MFTLAHGFAIDGQAALILIGICLAIAVAWFTGVYCAARWVWRKGERTGAVLVWAAGFGLPYWWVFC